MSGTIGDNVYRASGVIAAAAGGGGAVSWQTGSIKVTGDSPVTGVAGEGYFLNTTAGAITLNLPAGVAGEMIGASDYAQTWDSNNLTLAPNGSDKIGGTNDDAILKTAGQSVVLIYVDATQGWIDVQDSTSAIAGGSFIVATGGTPACGTTCGDYKIHTFTGPGTFCVSALSSSAPFNVVDYLVVAGGGGGASNNGGGGGGAGGFRASSSTFTNCGPSAPRTTPASCSAALPVAVAGYPVTVGGGGAGGVDSSPSGAVGSSGVDSVFTGTTTITSTGGGGANARIGPQPVPVSGGSGGGGGAGGPGGTHGPGAVGGAGNTPPTTPPQGSTGGAGTAGAPAPLGHYGGGGGGGAMAVGKPAYSDVPCDERSLGADGGGFPGSVFGCNGEPCGSNRYYAGGGGGSRCGPVPSPAVLTGGLGGGGLGSYGCSSPGLPPLADRSGTDNTGGGGGGNNDAPISPSAGGAGGSGIVVIRYKYQ